MEKYFFASVEYLLPTIDYFGNIDGYKPVIASDTFTSSGYPSKSEIILAVVGQHSADNDNCNIISYSELTKEQYDAYNSDRI